MRIEVYQRKHFRIPMDNGMTVPTYYARIKEHPEAYAIGNSPNAAVGQLVCTHQELFDLEVFYPGEIDK